MTTLRMATLWEDPRTGVWMLRRRIPDRYKAVSGRRGTVVKLTTGTADRKAAQKAWPAVLAKWDALVAEWERALNVVVLTHERAQEIAAAWSAWIAGGAQLQTDGVSVADIDGYSMGWAIRLESHADEALRLAGIAIAPDTRPWLLKAMHPPVRAAYEAFWRERDHERVAAFLARAALPTVDGAPPIAAPVVSLAGMLDAWKAVATVKPRTVTETEYAFDLLRSFLGHDDAARLSRDDLLRWRGAMKEKGATNNTWNNRLSMIRQVFLRAVDDGKLTTDPTINLRLAKSQNKSPLPYSDDDAARILRAARSETKPSLRWAHWIMAFSGMRAGEVLQLLGRDIRQDGGVWLIDVNEDHPTKSVKTSERRNVPIHQALVDEGLLAYATTIAPDAPLFPDKALGAHGKRGERAWNVVGKWVRDTVGITDPLKAPDHSWRHRIEDELRAAEVPEDARDAILGHARKTTGRNYGVRGEALTRLHRYLSKVPVPPGVTGKAA